MAGTPFVKTGYQNYKQEETVKPVYVLSKPKCLKIAGAVYLKHVKLIFIA